MKHDQEQTNNDMIPVVIREDDFQLIKGLLQGLQEEDAGMNLLHEMNRAIVVKREAFPTHAIGLNSGVSVQNLETGKEKTFTIVMPEKADIKHSRISVLSPMGAALLGFRKGEEVVWRMPGGLTRIRILDVVNHDSRQLTGT